MGNRIHDRVASCSESIARLWSLEISLGVWPEVRNYPSDPGKLWVNHDIALSSHSPSPTTSLLLTSCPSRVHTLSHLHLKHRTEQNRTPVCQRRNFGNHLHGSREKLHTVLRLQLMAWAPPLPHSRRGALCLLVTLAGPLRSAPPQAFPTLRCGKRSGSGFLFFI